MMSAALDMALSYARDRQMFGKAELDFQGIQWMLADVATDLEASRWELLRSRNTLRALFDNIPQSIYIIDHKYNLVARPGVDPEDAMPGRLRLGRDDADLLANERVQKR